MAKMTRGSANLELSFLIENDVLTEIGVESPIRLGSVCGRALTKSERDAVWLALPEWLQERLMNDAAEDAEPVADDDGADDAAFCGRAV